MSWRRRDVLAGLAAAGALTACGAPASTRAGAPETPEPATDKEAPMDASSRMPVLFVGHGSPMNAIEDNRWAQGFAALSEGISRPKAILAISAHWFVPGTYLTSNEQPPTIHDFGGFPQALYEVQYPARGSVDLAKRVRGLLAESGAELRSDWGLDHGTWSVLRHMYPDADVPVVQLSIDRRLRAAQHLELARSLADLRDEGVLIVGSGNMTHNLRDAITHMRTGDTSTPKWARRFDTDVNAALEQHDTKAVLAHDPSVSDVGRMAHPSPDHWLPLIYAYGATDENDAGRSPISGFDWGSLSMRSVRFG